MPDFRANIPIGYEKYEDRYQSLGDDTPKEKPPLPQDEEIQKATSPLLKEFVNKLSELNQNMIINDHHMELIEKDRILEDLKELRGLLEALIETNESHNSDYLLKISIVWNHIIETSNLVKMVDLKKSINMDLLRKFIESLNRYPDHGDFSLSYYMTQFPGKQWHPFPLMEIFQYLHEEAQNEHISSKLKEWIATLNEIIPNSEGSS